MSLRITDVHHIEKISIPKCMGNANGSKVASHEGTQQYY